MILLMHPNTLPLFLERVNAANAQRERAGLPGIDLEGARVQLDEFVQERIETAEYWSPPRGDRFVEYDRKDFAWLRPFGEGDFDLVVYVLDERELVLPFRPRPRPFFTFPATLPEGPTLRI